jgi:hypothetical protein
MYARLGRLVVLAGAIAREDAFPRVVWPNRKHLSSEAIGSEPLSHLLHGRSTAGRFRGIVTGHDKKTWARLILAGGDHVTRP